MSRYKVLLWDIDGTVLNFKASEKAAIRKGFARMKLGECTDAMLEEYSEINERYWQKLERGELTKDRVLEGRFEEFFEKKGIPVSYAASFNAHYQVDLSDVICENDDAISLIRKLKGKVLQYAVTNGTITAQKKKLRNSGLDQILDDVFISDEIGVEKPMKGFFDAVFMKMPPVEPSEVLIIGDSLTSDIRGGENAGIHTCWYNPEGKENTKGVRVDYQIRSLQEIPGLI